MSHPYSEETQRILDDFLKTLAEDGGTAPDLLAELRRMMAAGALESPTCIRQAIAQLEAKADELYHRPDPGPEL